MRQRQRNIANELDVSRDDEGSGASGKSCGLLFATPGEDGVFLPDGCGDFHELDEGFGVRHGSLSVHATTQSFIESFTRSDGDHSANLLQIVYFKGSSKCTTAFY